MSAIVLSNLSGLTVTYSGFQFGGADSAYKTTPPEYSFNGEFIKDDSGRAIEATEYTMTVSTIVYETSEDAVSLNMAAAQARLGRHGGSLTIEGLGTGFDGTYTPNQDLAWGPMPIGVQCRPFGYLAWSCVWAVKFRIKQCVNGQGQGEHAPLAFMAFNFATSWKNDFEGLCTRTISGYAKIAISRDILTGTIPQHVADEVRDNINILVPNGFRRIEDDWQENISKERLDFTVTDESMPGDPLPAGIIMADGDVTFGSEGPGFAMAQVTMSMTMRVAPDKPRNLAGVIFLAACITKTNALNTANANGSVIPSGIQLRQGKFNRAREFSGTFTWSLTKCINDMLKASGLWEPVTEGNYEQWRTSIQNLWGNRGLKIEGVALRSQASEAVVIDLCSNKTSMTIGATPSLSPNHQEPSLYNPFTCPDIPANGGWMGHDLKLTLLREDEMTWHKKAVTFNPSPGQTSQGASEGKTAVGGPGYTQSNDQLHDVEHHGFPVLYVLLQFKGLRLKHNPEVPELVSVGGKLATHVKSSPMVVTTPFDVLTCPAKYVAGWRLYRVQGPIDSTLPTKSMTSCASAVPAEEVNSQGNMKPVKV